MTSEAKDPEGDIALASYKRLIATLKDARQRFDAGSEGWRWLLLQGFLDHFHALGIEKRLLDPIQRMALDEADKVRKEQRRRHGKGSKGIPMHRAAVLQFAAACVTLLKKRGDFGTIDNAIRAVSRASGLTVRELRSFRDNINRGVYSEDLIKAYDYALLKCSYIPTPEMMQVLSGIAVFVKSPSLSNTTQE